MCRTVTASSCSGSRHTWFVGVQLLRRCRYRPVSRVQPTLSVRRVPRVHHLHPLLHKTKVSTCTVCTYATPDAHGVRRPAAAVLFNPQTVTKFVWNYNPSRIEPTPHEVTNNLHVPEGTPHVLTCIGDIVELVATETALCPEHVWVDFPCDRDLRIYVIQFKRMDTTLEEVLQGPERPLEWRISVGAKIARGVAELHALGIRHYDLKPENILMSDDGEEVYVADLGIGQGVPVSGLVYSESCRAPEVYIDGVGDTASDVYALAVILLGLQVWYPSPLWVRNRFEDVWFEFTARYAPRPFVQPSKIEAIGLWCMLVFHGVHWVKNVQKIFPGRGVWTAVDAFLAAYPQCREWIMWGVSHLIDGPLVTGGLAVDMRARPSAAAIAEYLAGLN